MNMNHDEDGMAKNAGLPERIGSGGLNGGEKDAREGSVVLYTTEDGRVAVNALLRGETLWMTQRGMANVFGVGTQAVAKHLKNIFESGELRESATCSKMEQVRREGNREVRRTIDVYNLDAIISVGYRVNSRQATRFRIWATGVLREYIVKGFALDDRRLKRGGNPFGEDYFQELLERIRSIRASERRIWQQITDIFAECSTDYDRESPVTRDFYAMVQNKFHYAITGRTAAEIVAAGADHRKPNMGLSTWENAPEGRILKRDALVAKNYLSEADIRRLERTVTGFFDYIEGLVDRGNTFTMEGFAESVDAFLSFNRFEVLEGRGRVSRAEAEQRAGEEYERFNRTQPIVSDFDRAVRRLLENGKRECAGNGQKNRNRREEN